MPLTYSTYLKIDELLSLQQPLSEGPEHDEMLFIVIHQVYELWFKQVLHEVGLLQNSLEQDDIPRALGTFKRILTIFKTLVSQVDILETMTPVNFTSFRTRLESSSGFQSVQFRILEFALGYRRPEMMVHYPKESEERKKLEAWLTKPSLYDSFLICLRENGVDIPPSVFERDLSRPIEPNTEIQECLVDIYRMDPTLTAVCERMIDLDEGLQEWRYRHVKMVERTIGTKTGTGGSSGADYLKRTLFKPLFPDLWEIRAQL